MPFRRVHVALLFVCLLSAGSASCVARRRLIARKGVSNTQPLLIADRQTLLESLVRQYEAVRAFIKEQISAEEVALRFGYTPATVYTMVRDARAGKTRLFPEVRLGPKGRRTSEETKDRIIRMRKDDLSSTDIHQRLASEVSISTIERILKESGIDK